MLDYAFNDHASMCLLQRVRIRVGLEVALDQSIILRDQYMRCLSRKYLVALIMVSTRSI